MGPNYGTFFLGHKGYERAEALREENVTLVQFKKKAFDVSTSTEHSFH